MAHAFQTIPAKPAFATLRQNLSQSDYINRKKGLLIYCNSPSHCNRLRITPSYNIRNSFNTGRSAINLSRCNNLPINKSNLIIGQYTASNLSQVCSVSNIFPYTTPTPCSSDYPCNPCQNNNAVQLSTSDIFYNKFIIDPNGELFGKTQCGELNFTQFMLFYPPTPPTN
jgi:hypothetical protein